MPRRHHFSIIAAAIALGGPISAQTVLYWDTNGSTAGSSSGTTAPGSWVLGSNWSTASDGTAATQTWSDGNTAVFSAGTNATGDYTVALGSYATAANVTVNIGNVTLTNAQLTVPAIDVASGSTLTIASDLQYGSLIKSGAGTLTLTGAVQTSDASSNLFTVAAGNVVVSGSHATFTVLGTRGLSNLNFSGAAGTSLTVENGALVGPKDMVLSGQLALNVASGGIIQMYGNITIGSGTPTVTLSGGTLTSNSADFAGFVAPQLNLAAATTSTIDLGSLVSYSLTGGITGAGALDKTGLGTLTIDGDNGSFTGGMTLSGGTVALGHANALGTGPLTFAGGNLLVQGVSPTYTPFVIQNGSTTVTGSGTVLSSLTYAEVGHGGAGTLSISGQGKVSAATSVVAGISTGGAGTITVDGSGSSLATGSFFVAGYDAGTTGSLTLTNGATATVGQYALVGNNGSGTVSVGSGATLTTTQDLNLGSAATGSGSLAIAGGGNVTTGANAYIGYAGNSTADVAGTGSTWYVGGTLYMGFGAAGNLTIDSGATVAADTVDLARNAGSSGTITVNAGGTLELGGLTAGAGAAAMNFSGGTLEAISRSFATSVPISLTNGTTATVLVNGLSVQFNGAISGGGGLIKDGAGIVTLGAANSYAGGTTLVAGTLALGDAAALGVTTAPLTLYGGTLDLGGFSPTIGAVVFNGGSFTNGTLGNAASFELQSGVLSSLLSGAAGVTKTGAGTFALTGANTYTGATAVKAGTLALGNASALGATSGVTVAAGATLDLGSFTLSVPGLDGAGAVALGSGALQVGDASNHSFAGSLSGTGTLTKVGAGTLTLSGASSYSGGTTVNAGGIILGHAAALGSGPLTLSGGSVDLGGFTAALSGLTLGGGTLSNGQLNIASSIELQTGSTAASLGGTAALTKTGGAAFTMTGNNTYTGATTISAGELDLTGSAARISDTSSLTVAGGGLLGISGGGQFTASGNGVIDDASGTSASISVTGTGSRLVIGGALTVGQYGNGTLTVSNGGLVNVGSYVLLSMPPTNAPPANGILDLQTGGTLQVGGTDGVRIGSAPDPLYPFISSNPTINGNGYFDLSGGTLEVSGSSLTTSVPILLTNTSTINTNGLNATFSGVLWDGLGAQLHAYATANPALATVETAGSVGDLTKTGAGTLTLTAANIYQGNTTISAGTLALGAGGSLESKSIHVASGATFDVTGAGGFTLGSGQVLGGAGTVTGNLTVANGATLSSGGTPGLLTVNGNLSLLGTTMMSLAAAAVRGTDYDAIDTTGTLAFGGTLSVSLLNGYMPTAGTSFDLFNVGGGTTGAFGSLNLPSLAGGLQWDTSNLYTNGSLSVTMSAVPEPSTYAAILGACALGATLWRKRRRGSHAAADNNV